MAINARCSNKSCFVTAYDVTIEAGDVEGTVELNIVDPCNTMQDNCRAKAILIKAYKDWLDNQDESTAGLTSCRDTFCVGGAGTSLTYYNADQKLVAVTAVTAPSTQLVATVTLPLSCDNVTFADPDATTTTPTP